MENLRKGQTVNFIYNKTPYTGLFCGYEDLCGIKLCRVLPDSYRLGKEIRKTLGRNFFLFKQTNVTVAVAESMLKENNPNSTFKRRIRE